MRENPRASAAEVQTRADDPSTGCGSLLARFGYRGKKAKELVHTHEDGLVLGEINPDTVLVIEHDTTITGDIYLTANAQLIVRRCNFGLLGDLCATGNSTASFEEAEVTIFQEHIYQRTLLAVDSACIAFRGCVLNSSNFPITAAVAARAQFSMDTVEMDGAFITFGMFDNASVDVRCADRAGEFVLLCDSCSLVAKKSDSILIWLGFADGSRCELHNPFGEAGFVESFVFPDTLCGGIGYVVRLDSLNDPLWALMVEDGAEVEAHDADIFGCGNIFLSASGDTIRGIVNGAYYDDFFAPLPARSLHLVNSSVRTWNFYAFENADIVLQSCIFGECLADSTSSATILNATCDGTGGHIGANGSSVMTVLQSTLFSEALLGGRSVSLLFYTNFVWGNLIACDRALALLYNSVVPDPILVYDSAAVFEASLNLPAPTRVDDSIYITGTARDVRTDLSPFEYEGYRIEYAPEGDTSHFTPLTGTIEHPVHNDTLCCFPTLGLEPGSYVIRLWYIFSAYGARDSVPLTSTVYLAPNAGIGRKDAPKVTLTASPNPFKTSCSFNVPSGACLSIYDHTGRLVYRAEAPAKRKSRTSTITWSPPHKLPQGIYIAALSLGGERKTTKLLYIK